MADYSPLPPATTFEELDAKLDQMAANGRDIVAALQKRIGLTRLLLWISSFVAVLGLTGAVLGFVAVHHNCTSINHDRAINAAFWNHYVDRVTESLPRDENGEIADPKTRVDVARFRMDIQQSYAPKGCSWLRVTA